MFLPASEGVGSLQDLTGLLLSSFYEAGADIEKVQFRKGAVPRSLLTGQLQIYIGLRAKHG